MEITGVIVAQLFVNVLLGTLVVFCLLHSGHRAPPDTGYDERQDGLQEEIKNWETTSGDLLVQMRNRVQELENLVEELDRAEIRASDTIRKLEQMESGWTSSAERYIRALGWIREGIPMEEVAQRTQMNLDELRLVEELSKANREKHEDQ
jgi:hypothetical protein